ncbi:hypothetical protein BS47DRAFT_1343234 [Hydnum rufescens UP504]|uniref:Uncharacterized protein n=1 Tax=Hydnum rufescens UP504 TaxID=1448309 RepID=A0A9P6B0V2_9AGAM|nr:hypothetical protein BS47DRAFT_1343234 [Hydnum rufescens UP504]
MSAATSSLSSVVSQLMRASMGASVSPTVKDEDLDHYVAELILKEAKQAEERYKGKDGIRAYLPHTGLPDNNLPKANKRFLHSIIRNVDDHNTAVLRAQARAAEEVRLQRRRRREQTAEHEHLRHLRSDCVGSWAAGGGVVGSIPVKQRLIARRDPNESDLQLQVGIGSGMTGETLMIVMTMDAAQNEDTGLIGGMMVVRPRGASHAAPMATAIIVVMNLTVTLKLHLPRTPPQTLRKERNRSSSPRDLSPSSTASYKRPSRDNTTTIGENEADSGANSRSPGSPSLDEKEQFFRHSQRTRDTSSSHKLDDNHTPQSRSPSEDRHHSHRSSRRHSSRKEKLNQDASPPRNSDEREHSSHRRRSRRHHSPTESHRRGVSRSNDRHSPSRSRSPSEDRRRSHRPSRTHSSRSERHKGGTPEDEPHDTEGAIAPSSLSSKMDKYFDPKYDPSSIMSLPWIQIPSSRREREGVSPSGSKWTGTDTEPNLTEIVYKKRGKE